MRRIDSIISGSAARHSGRPALIAGGQILLYSALEDQVRRAAAGLARLDLPAGSRIAVYLPKTVEAVVAMFAASRAGHVFVPVNPVLKPAQVHHILADSGAAVLVTSRMRLTALHRRSDDSASPAASLPAHVILTDPADADSASSWRQLLESIPDGPPPEKSGAMGAEAALAAILYTSGSTGLPKGVMFSHQNLIIGALSVTSYLGNIEHDRLLAVLPFSFDYGLSQLTTAFSVGASVSLLDYLTPRDVLKAVQRDKITGLAGVPPLWSQLLELDWPHEVRASLRYITNSGGKMPRAVLTAIRQKLPQARVYLMYGLTEAFRSTYLDPALVDARPDSMGKAVPFAQVRVVRPDGRETVPDEPGELIHMGPLVTMGYWQAPEKTAQRFRPAPDWADDVKPGDLAVWSGDTVRRDAEGFLYFVSRADQMIKTSGYRVSPSEVEDAVYGSGLIADVVAFGVEDDRLGAAIHVALAPRGDALFEDVEPALMAHLRQQLPAYMVPAVLHWREGLPRNANGKLDRTRIIAELGAGT